jgi:PPP family 3-phenylpropionic acid transporter
MGLFFPYASLYLRENAGLSETQVGLVLAVQPIVGLVAQPGWGHLADRTGDRSRILAGLALASGLLLALFGRLQGFVALVAGMALLSAFHVAVVPSLTAVTLAGLEAGRRHWYGVVRAFGTLGFAVSVIGFPPLLDRLQAARGWVPAPGGPSEPGLEVLFLVAGGFGVASAGVGLLLPRSGAVRLAAERGAWRALLRHGPFLRLLAVFFAGFFALHGPMVLFPVYLRSLGGGLADVGHAWAWMLALEIPLLIGAGVLAERSDPRLLLAIGLVAGGLRWAACGLVDDLRLVYPIQLLHGASVAGLLTGGPLYLDAVVPRRLRSTAQGILALTGAGIGGAASAALTGRLMQELGGQRPYLLLGALAVLVGLLVLPLLPRVVRPGGGSD